MPAASHNVRMKGKRIAVDAAAVANCFVYSSCCVILYGSPSVHDGPVDGMIVVLVVS